MEGQKVFMSYTFRITFMLLIKKNYWYTRAKNDGRSRYANFTFDVQSSEILWKPSGFKGMGEWDESSNIMWRRCTTPMSRGCLLLLPVVAAIRSEISELRKVGISSPAPTSERTDKEGRAKWKTVEIPEYRKPTQACNSLNNVKCVLFSKTT